MPGSGKNHVACDVKINLYCQKTRKSLFFNYIIRHKSQMTSLKEMIQSFTNLPNMFLKKKKANKNFYKIKGQN